MFTKARKNLPLWAGLSILLIVMLFAQSISPALAATAANTLTVNANQVLRPVTHVASGSLYGLATASKPAASKIAPIKPNTFVQMPQGGKQQGTGDISVVAPLAVGVGAKLVNRMVDYYAGWPYQFSWSTWTPFVTSQINAMKAASYYSSISAYEPWNEADNTWDTANGTFNDFWVTTYRQIRALDPTKPIQGPSFSDNISGNSRAPSMQAFLQNAKDTNTLPDIIAWHELIRASKIEGDVNTVKSIMSNLGISSRPFAIEEYAAPAEVGLPGPLVGYVAKFERLGIRDAELPFWNQSGALGDLLTGQDGSPNAAYWMYKWYADMSGNMVVTTPPAQTGIDGFAAVPSGNNKVSIIVGGCSGSCAVTVNGLNSLSLGSTVSVKIEQTVSQGRTVAVSGPSTISTTTYTPSNGTISVPITMVTNNAYLITITPGNGPTNTPPVGPTATRTPTPTAGPSLTPTRTPTQGTGPTATPTTPSGGACSPVTATITAPFTQDGAGTFCWQSSNLGAYINSWNLTSLTVNGTNYTNVYVASGSYPAKINGYWYISYTGTVAWAHFEAK
jgi:hypothetical protein